MMFIIQNGIRSNFVVLLYNITIFFFIYFYIVSEPPSTQTSTPHNQTHTTHNDTTHNNHEDDEKKTPKKNDTKFSHSINNKTATVLLIIPTTKSTRCRLKPTLHHQP